MKILLIVCLFCLLGCSKSLDKGNIPLSQMGDKINEKIIEKQLPLPLLKESQRNDQLLILESIIKQQPFKVWIINNNQTEMINKIQKQKLPLYQYFDYTVIIEGKNADKFMKLLKP